MTVLEDRILRGDTPGQYAVVKRADAVVVIPVSPDGRTLLLDSYRYPTGRNSFEFPMGGIDSGGSPVAAATRELREETTLVGSQLEEVGWYYALPGLTDQRVHVFVCRMSDDAFENASTPTSDDGSDDLRGTRTVDIRSIPEMIKNGEITDSLTLCSLLLSGILDKPEPLTAAGRRPGESRDCL